MKAGQFNKLNELAAEVLRQNEAKKDFIAPTSTAVFHGNNLNLDGDVLDTTKHFSRQVATWGNVPAGYIEKLHTENPELMADNLNWALGKQEAHRMFRVLDGKARAFMSDRYKIIDNAPVLESAVTALEGLQTQTELVSCDVTDNKMYMKLVSPKVEGEIKKGDPVQMGLVISNSEIGLGSYQIQPMVYRLVCENGMVSPKEIGGEYGINMKHLGAKLSQGMVFQHDTVAMDVQSFALKVRDIINYVFSEEMLQKHMQAFRDLAEQEIRGDVSKAVEVTAKKLMLTKHETNDVLKNLIRGGDTSRYGLLNAITRTSQDIKSYDRASKLEEIGGKVITLSRKDWKDIAEAA